MDSYRVFKFGGSSVGDATRLTEIIKLLGREIQKSKIAVVVSAMGDVTDWLLDACHSACSGDLTKAHDIVDKATDLAFTNTLIVLRNFSDSNPNVFSSEITTKVRALVAPLKQLLLGISLIHEIPPSAQDTIISFGERISSVVVSELLSANKIPSISVDARNWLVTDATFGNAKVLWEQSLVKFLEISKSWGDKVPVITGFIGQTADGRTTTLGRNGSDYTATLVGSALKALEVVICTDVSGVMTADPRIIEGVIPVPKLSYFEALELANYGTKMFHPRTMLPLIESGIPLRIRNTLIPDDKGTVVDAYGIASSGGPTCVTSLENLAIINLRWRQLLEQTRMGSQLLKALRDANVTVWMSTHAAHGQAVTIVIPINQMEIAKSVINSEFSSELQSHIIEPISSQAPVTLLSLVAEKLSHDAAGKFFGALSQIGVRILSIAQGAGSRSVSCVIPSEDTITAVTTVHAAFNFSHQIVNLILWGEEQSEDLFQLIESQKERLEKKKIHLKVIGYGSDNSNNNNFYFDRKGLSLADIKNSNAAKIPLNEVLQKCTKLETTFLVDCNNSSVTDIYANAFDKGVHVISSNKKAVASDQFYSLKQKSAETHRVFDYEPTVGISLPITDTLHSLERAGDRVTSVEVSLSGTLGYICTSVMEGNKLSTAFREALKLGFTEKNPLNDLSGEDIAAKSLILARELGIQLSLQQVQLQSLLPSQLIQKLTTTTAMTTGITTDYDNIIKVVEEYDEEFDSECKKNKADGKILRYITTINPSNSVAAVKIEPTWISSENPFSQLKKSDVMFTLRTEGTYSERPLIVQGARAGCRNVTAILLSNILKIANKLRGIPQ